MWGHRFPACSATEQLREHEASEEDDAFKAMVLKVAPMGPPTRRIQGLYCGLLGTKMDPYTVEKLFTEARAALSGDLKKVLRPQEHDRG